MPDEIENEDVEKCVECLLLARVSKLKSSVETNLERRAAQGMPLSRIRGIDEGIALATTEIQKLFAEKPDMGCNCDKAGA